MIYLTYIAGGTAAVPNPFFPNSGSFPINPALQKLSQAKKMSLGLGSLTICVCVALYCMFTQSQCSRSYFS